MIIGVIGGRDTDPNIIFDNQALVDAALERVMAAYSLDYSDVTLIHGGGRGTELLSLAWAQKHNVEAKLVPPNKVSKPAGGRSEEYLSAVNETFRERNIRIISQSDVMLFFFDGMSQAIREAMMATSHNRKSFFCVSMQQ